MGYFSEFFEGQRAAEVGLDMVDHSIDPGNVLLVQGAWVGHLLRSTTSTKSAIFTAWIRGCGSRSTGITLEP